MKTIIKFLSLFGLILTNYINLLFSIEKTIIIILNIIFISLFVFIEGNKIKTFNKKIWLKNYILKYVILLLFWNVTYLVIKQGLFINNKEFFEIAIDTILLKNIIFELFKILIICYLFIPLVNKKIFLIIAEIISIILLLIFKDFIFIYISIFILGMLLNSIIIKNSKNKILNIINDHSDAIYIFHIFLIQILLILNIISKNNISDLIGALVLTYLIGTLSSIYFKFLPIIRNLL